MAQLNFGGTTETVVIRDEFPLEKAREVLKNETIAVIGYGVQGPGQALNLRDNGFNVIVGQREGKTYDKAVADGWVPGETLFGIEEACEKGTIVMCLLSDAAVMSVWPTIKPYLTAGKALYFSHGFAITWNNRTGVVPPADIDVIMVAPKGSGTSLRTMFLEGRGLNSSYAIYQDATGKAYERTIALGIGIGSGYLFETTFQREATSDLTGERGSLMGAIQGLLLAQYEVLRENGHSPSEAFNETVEELTQSLMPLFAKNGMDWMYANCSTTAQRGALDWMGPFHDVIVMVTVRPSEVFQRDGYDVWVTVPITYSQAVLGDNVTVPSIDGKVEYTVPEGTQSGTTFRLRGKGIQYLNGRGRGDMYVKCEVEIPKKLNKTQREALKKFEGTLKEENYEKRKGFFKKLKDMFNA